MSRRILRHRRLADGTYELVVHLDDTKSTAVKNEKGEVVGQELDPTLVREFAFRPLEAPTPQTDKLGEFKLDKEGNIVVKAQKLYPTEAEYLDAQLAEVRLLIDAEAAGSKKLPSEGNEL